MTLLVWDLDGTLADTFSAIRASATAALAAHGYGAVDDAVLRASGGLALAQLLTRLVGPPAPSGETLVAMEAAFREVFPAHAARAGLFPGVDALLAELTDRGVTLAVATGRRRSSTVALLDRFGIADRFASVQCEDDMPRGRGKPFPDLLLAACAECGQEAAEAVVIGDSTYDVVMGRAAGARTIAVTWGHTDADTLRDAGPDHMVDDLDTLRLVLASL